MHVGLVDLSWDGHHTPYVIYLSKYFTEREHQVTFFTDSANPRLNELPDSDNLTVRALSLPKTDVDPSGGLLHSVWEQVLRGRQLRQIFNVIEGIDIDIIHFLYFDRTQLPLWATTRNDGSALPPIVATLHRDAFTDGSRRGWAKQFTQRATRGSLGGTLREGTLDCLTVHADSIRDRIIESVPGATETNTRTIPAPTPELSMDVSQVTAREHLDLPPTDTIALFFGGLRYEKGPDLLAEAVRDLDQPLTVVFAGAEVDFGQADVTAWARNSTPSVEILERVGFIPEDDLDYYFLAADVLVLPYRRRRGISGPLRRACAAGTPVISNKGSDIGELIETNDLGWTFEHNSVKSLRSTINIFLEEYGTFPVDALQQYASEHHWEETGKALESIYIQLPETRSGTPKTSQFQ